MIKVHGSASGSEARAARDLASLLTEHWPWIVNDKSRSIDIFVSAKLYGQRTRDVDVLLLIDFGLNPLKIGKSGSTVLDSLCVTIEVKDHDAPRVNYLWNQVEVLYDDGWKNASEQAFNQRNALRRYARSQGLRDIVVQEIVWLRNVSEETIPAAVQTTIGGDVDVETLFVKIANDHPGSRLQAFERDSRDFRKLCGVIVSQLRPTALDRRRLEALFAQSAIDDRLKSYGTKLQLIRGLGGTGKTMLLLHTGWRAYQRDASRAVVLTYNRALRSDIRRQLALMGVLEDDGFEVRTVHSFLRELFVELGFLDTSQSDEDEDFFRKMEIAAPEALRFLQSTAREEIDTFLESKSSFRRALILVDEGQDWPAVERDLVIALYGAERLMIADGVDQLVRGPACDWLAGVSKQHVNVVPLDRCMRMMRNLGEFVNAVAEEIGLASYRIDTRGSEMGGTVLILEGNYTSSRSIHDLLVSRNAGEGNCNVDMLFAVPPQLVDTIDGDRVAYPALVLEQWGFKVWDGTSSAVRSGFAVDNEQLRIVQYESCRGLEGWTVVALKLDEFFELKSFESETAALRWLVICLTRAISHLVIVVGERESRLKTVLRSVRSRFPEIVEWRRIT